MFRQCCGRAPYLAQASSPTDAKSVLSPSTPRRAGHVDTPQANVRRHMTTEQPNTSGSTPARSGEWERRRFSSRVLHRAGAVLEEPSAGLIVAACIVVWAIMGAATRFPNWWQVADPDGARGIQTKTKEGRRQPDASPPSKVRRPSCRPSCSSLRRRRR
jgi:hypothetical protein